MGRSRSVGWFAVAARTGAGPGVSVRVILPDRAGRLRASRASGPWPPEADRLSSDRRRDVFASGVEEQIELRSSRGAAFAIVPFAGQDGTVGLCEILGPRGAIANARRAIEAFAAQAGLHLDGSGNGAGPAVLPSFRSTRPDLASDLDGWGLEGVRVFIVDRQTLFADAIRSILEQRGAEVLGIAADLDEACARLPAEPDLILADLDLTDPGQPSGVRRLRVRFPDARIVALTSPRGPHPLREIARHGIHGSLSKDTKLSEFVRSLRAALNGTVIVNHRAPSGAPRPDPEDRHAAFLAEQLTPRESQVLGMLVEGARSSEIASRLGASPNTVRTHVQSVLTKLQVHSRLEAAAFAVRHRLVRVPGERRSR